ncbi:MAG TPA: hypothetical protein PKC28_06580 [Bdellovibrionales bacterium]|nr:hypothetical protein [Bdellovibrionales bacterium]
MWGIVSGIHNLIVYGLLTVAIGAAALFVIAMMVLILDSRGKSKQIEPEPEEIAPPPRAVLSSEEIEKQKREYKEMLKEAREIEAQEKKRVEAEQLLEEQRKIDAIKARRERSAEDVARSGLDDFL